jgi:peptide/nickel transport system substrate-binding protein
MFSPELLGDGMKVSKSMMMNHKERGFTRLSKRLVLALAAALVLTGCSSGGESATSEITIVLPEEPRSLASWNAYSNDGHPILRNIGEALVNRDPVSNELVGELATSWEQVDPKNWQFTLREGVTFTDGTPFNAEAAAAGLNYVLSEANAFPMRNFLGSQTTASAVSEYLLNVATVDPDPILDLRLYFVTIPQAAAIAADPASYETNPIGTGPYKLTSWTRGESIVLEQNTDWWGNSSPDDAKGTQSIAKATYVFRTEQTVRSAMVEAGEADFSRWISPEDCDAGVVVCLGGATVETGILRLDNVHPAMKDLRVRTAMALAFDKQEVMDLIGGGDPVPQIVGPSALGFNDDLEPFAKDVEKAKALIAEAKAAGVNVSAPITVAARTGFVANGQEALTYIADAFNAIGLTAKTTMLDTAAAEKQWTMGYKNIPKDRGWAGFWFHGNELMDYSASVGSYYACNGPVSAYCNPKVDALYKEALQATGQDRDTKLAAIAAFVYNDAAVIPVGQPLFYFGLSDKINWAPRMDGFILLKEISFKS